MDQRFRVPPRAPASLPSVPVYESPGGLDAPADMLAGSAESRARLVMLRAIVWGLIGLIYAPLFVGLTGLLDGAGLGLWSYVVAAGLAGGAGAVLYGGRELALLGTGIGLVLGWAALLADLPWLGFGEAAVAAGAVAAAVGLSPLFAARCTRHVPAKVLAGMTTGLLVGSVLAIAEPLHPHPFSAFAQLAFMVSVNGVLYVASVRGWVNLMGRMARRARSWPCNLAEAGTAAVLAGLGAGSVWIMAGPLLGLGLGQADGLVREVGQLVYSSLPLALLGGVFGGALAGALLELFGFRWVHDV